MLTKATPKYSVLTLSALRDALLSPISKTGTQFKNFVLENLTIDPNSNLTPKKYGTRWITVIDPEKNRARVCINRNVWQRAVDKGFVITKDVAIDVAIETLTLDKYYQVQIEARGVRVGGQSQIEALRESINKYCESKGYFDRPKKSLPVIVRKIAIITSQQSTIESDITKQIGIKNPLIDAYRFDGTAEDLSSIILTIAANQKHDIICLYRGGREDEYMFVYSDPMVLDEIVKSPIPVVSAIGHERDNPPVQFVVDVGFASPSRFAAAIKQRNIDALEGAGQIVKSINHHFYNYITKLEKSIILSIGNIDKISSKIEQQHQRKAHKRNLATVVLIAGALIVGIILFFLMM